MVKKKQCRIFNMCDVCFVAKKTIFQCQECRARACRRCMQTWASERADVQCTGCNKPQPKEEWNRLVSRTFSRTQLRKVRFRHFLAREEGRLCQSAPQAERMRLRREEKDVVSALVDAIERGEYVAHVYELTSRLERVRQAMEASEQQMKRACPVADCAGFVDGEGRCSACRRIYCVHCEEEVRGDV